MPILDDFHEIRFPLDIAFGSSGGPSRNTEIVTLGSGKEHRNQRWYHSRRQFDAGYGVKTLNSLYDVAEFYEARRGPLYGFRFRDPLDWKSCPPQDSPSYSDQIIGSDDGVQTEFQLSKSYGPATDDYQRSISKPVEGTVTVAIDGVEMSGVSEFTVDSTTGILSFQLAAPPAVGQVITAGYEFDVPVRFVDDDLRINVSSFSAGDVPSIPLLEVIK